MTHWGHVNFWSVVEVEDLMIGKGFFWGIGWAAVLGIGMAGGEANAARSLLPAIIETYEQNIRAGLAATTGFDLTTTAGVPRETRNARAEKETPTPWKQMTYPLYLHPHTQRYRIGEEQLRHLQWATLAWRTPENYPFVFDFYLHGDFHSDQLAVRIPDLDIRKFLHQSIAPLAYNGVGHRSDDALRLAQLQAYFEEFSRKGKVLFPLSPDSPTRVASTQSYRTRLSNRIRQDVAQALHRLQDEGDEAVQPLMVVIDLLDRPGPLQLAMMDRNLQAAILFQEQKNVSEKAMDHAAVLQQLVESVQSLNIAQRIASVKITNNCREPGLYEAELRDGEGRPLWRANFSFHTKLYN